MLIFERCEDFCAAGIEEFAGELVSEVAGIGGWAGDLSADKIFTVQIRYKSTNFDIVPNNFCKGPSRRVTAALHCRQNLSLCKSGYPGFFVIYGRNLLTQILIVTSHLNS